MVVIDEGEMIFGLDLISRKIKKLVFYIFVDLENDIAFSSILES